MQLNPNFRPTLPFRHEGYCPICDAPTVFTASELWFRDFLVCAACASIPRERALMSVIQQSYPNWRELTVHESSPAARGVSVRMKRETPNYSVSQYFPDIPPGKTHPERGERCENLERMTFPASSFDLFITQDVMEHVFDYERAFSEIARVLKPGGAHIFTVPIMNKARPTERRARMEPNGAINYLKEAQYHDNPVDPKGSLVTMDWGYDIADYILKASGLVSVIYYIDNIDCGIRAEFIEVVASYKR